MCARYYVENNFVLTTNPQRDTISVYRRLGGRTDLGKLPGPWTLTAAELDSN
jgi:hypothetical protein